MGVVEQVLNEHIEKCVKHRDTAIGLGWHTEVKIYEGIIKELTDIMEEIC